MTMSKFPFKCDDRYILRLGTATTMEMKMKTAMAIDVYGLRRQWPDGWWERHFSSRRVKR